MFGRTSKKAPSPAPRLCRVMAFTMDYWIDGMFNIDDDDFSWEDAFSFDNDFENPYFSDAKILPVTGLVTPPQTFTRIALPFGPELVALVPYDSVAIQQGMEAYQDYNQLVPAVIYAGPYVIKGNCQTDSGDLGSLISGDEDQIAIKDAQMDCLVPGTRMAEIKAPWMLVNPTLIQAIGLG